MKNPGVFSSGVLVRYTNIVYQNPGSPGILFAEPLANSQVVAWRDMGFVIEQNCCFIIVPIIVYLEFVVNQFGKKYFHMWPSKLINSLTLYSLSKSTSCCSKEISNPISSHIFFMENSADISANAF